MTNLTPPKSQYEDGRPAAHLRLPATDAGVVLRHDEATPGIDAGFDQFGARDVVVFTDEEMFYMHYDAAGPEGWLAALAVSSDGIMWRKRGPILPLGASGQPDAGSASYGVPHQDPSGRWHLFYLGTPNTSPAPERIPAFPYLTCKATASCPTGPWAKNYDVQPIVPIAGSFYEHTAAPGQIIKHDGGYIQFFSAARKEEDQILRTLGAAYTSDLNSTWQVDAEPILPQTEQVENSSVYYEKTSSTWFLFTNHVASNDDPAARIPPEGTAEYTDAIWVYWTQDLTSWSSDRKAVVLDGETCSWSSTIVGLPSVLPIDDKLAIYYDGRADGTFGHTQRDIGLCWLDLPLVPPVDKVQID